jgi:hypothetical protein
MMYVMYFLHHYNNNNIYNMNLLIFCQIKIFLEKKKEKKILTQQVFMQLARFDA